MPTSDALLNDINRAVGTLMERVDGLRVDVAESRADSRANRLLIFERLETGEKYAQQIEMRVVGRIERLEIVANEVVARVTKIEPTIATLGRLQQRGVGALSVVGLAATMIGGVLAIKWDALTDWLGSWWA